MLNSINLIIWIIFIHLHGSWSSYSSRSRLLRDLVGKSCGCGLSCPTIMSIVMAAPSFWGSRHLQKHQRWLCGVPRQHLAQRGSVQWIWGVGIGVAGDSHIGPSLRVHVNHVLLHMQQPGYFFNVFATEIAGHFPNAFLKTQVISKSCMSKSWQPLEPYEPCHAKQVEIKSTKYISYILNRV